MRLRAVASSRELVLLFSLCFGAYAADVPASPPAGQQRASQSAELQALRAQLAAQQAQIEKLQRAIEAQQKSLDQQTKTASTKESDANQIASTTPMVPVAMAKANTAVTPANGAAQSAEAKSPLSFGIGDAYITPVGFMDFTTVTRSTVSGSGISTNFGSIPFGNTTAGNMSETRFSTQNSRIGLRIDALVHGAKVLGYLESDFLGFAPGNIAVTSNSDSLRMRLYFADVRKGPIEVLAGQSWSLLTPNRKGLSPMPSDLFYSQNVDTNYQVGLLWSRDSQFRVVYHPSDTVAMGISLENPEQYIGGSGGAGPVVLPTSLQATYANELNNGGTTLNVPNLHPDIAAKVAFDPKSSAIPIHFEVGGVLRSFRTYNPADLEHFTTTGGGALANVILEPVKNFRLLSMNYWSDGGGRWIFGLAPDLVVRGDGGLSLIHSGSTVDGVELQVKNTLFSMYYGGVYIGRNAVIDPSSGKLVGYGYTGSSNGQNRTIQEGTFNINQTLWKDARYGALNLMFQYSYISRNPWYVATGTPANASQNVGFFDLRYTLPGSAPILK
ncbi:MAG TPA: hypothetical protein VG675_09030 [Bryobacteraceae bacterium]|nr:hypothetical protein [Bryobacteraceae bacterium]